MNDRRKGAAARLVLCSWDRMFGHQSSVLVPAKFKPKHLKRAKGLSPGVHTVSAWLVVRCCESLHSSRNNNDKNTRIHLCIIREGYVYLDLVRKSIDKLIKQESIQMESLTAEKTVNLMSFMLEFLVCWRSGATRNLLQDENNRHQAFKRCGTRH